MATTAQQPYKKPQPNNLAKKDRLHNTYKPVGQ